MKFVSPLETEALSFSMDHFQAFIFQFFAAQLIKSLTCSVQIVDLAFIPPDFCIFQRDQVI